MSKVQDNSITASDTSVPVQPIPDQINRYGITQPRAFSIYNDQGSVLYRGEVERVANELRAQFYGRNIADEPMDIKSAADRLEKTGVVTEEKASTAKVKGKRYEKKRMFFIVFPFILALVLVALYAISFFAFNGDQYLSLYNYTLTKLYPIKAADPVIWFINSLGVEIGLTSNFGLLMEGSESISNIAGYIAPIALAAYAILTIAMFIVTICGMAGKKGKDGYYKKACKLGLISILMFVLALATIAFTYIYVNGTDFSGITNFLMIGSEIGEIKMSYVGYAMVIIPIITFICSCLGYKRKK